MAVSPSPPASRPWCICLPACLSPKCLCLPRPFPMSVLSSVLRMSGPSRLSPVICLPYIRTFICHLSSVRHVKAVCFSRVLLPPYVRTVTSCPLSSTWQLSCPLSSVRQGCHLSSIRCSCHLSSIRCSCHLSSIRQDCHLSPVLSVRVRTVTCPLGT